MLLLLVESVRLRQHGRLHVAHTDGHDSLTLPTPVRLQGSSF